jgi:hypothetical protein
MKSGYSTQLTQGHEQFSRKLCHALRSCTLQYIVDPHASGTGHNCHVITDRHPEASRVNKKQKQDLAAENKGNAEQKKGPYQA